MLHFRAVASVVGFLLLAAGWQQAVGGVGPGGGITSPNIGGAGTLDILPGDGRSVVWSLDILSGTWTPYPAPAPLHAGGAIAQPFNGCDYAFAGGNTRTFFRTGAICGGTTQLADAPAPVGAGGSLVGAVGLVGAPEDTIFAIRGDGTTDFWGYSIANDAWEVLPDLPAPAFDGASLVQTQSPLGAGFAVWAMRGNGTSDMWVYDITARTWHDRTLFDAGPLTTPAPLGPGASLAQLQRLGHVYALRGGGSTDFWRYQFGGWTALAPVPEPVGAGGGLVGVNYGTVHQRDVLYALVGGGSDSIYEYDVATDTWSFVASVPPPDDDPQPPPPPPPPGPEPGHIVVIVRSAVDGSPLPGVVVEVFDESGVLADSGTTDAGGVLTSADLAAGDYHVRTSGTPGYVDELYHNIPCESGCDLLSGTIVEVATGGETEIAIALSPPGSIEGDITDGSTNAALPNVSVNVYTEGGQLAGTGVADSAGRYVVPNLTPGPYRLRTTNDQGYIDELYDNLSCALGCDVGTGTFVTVTVGASTEVDFKLLPPGGGIAGIVRDAASGAPLAGVEVRVYEQDGDGPVASAITTPEGQYLTQDVPTGSYFVRTINDQGYVDELYDDFSCVLGCDVTAGTPVTHTAGATGSFADFELMQGFRISGAVGATGGGPIEMVRVDIHDAAGAVVASGTTDAAGAYQAEPALPEGFYFARTHNGAGYNNELYDDLACVLGCDVTTGTAISTTLLASLGGVNFTLDGNTPVGMDVEVRPETIDDDTPVVITFSEVTDAGETTVEVSSTGPPLPGGFKIGNPPKYFEVATTATFVPPVEVCFDYTGVKFTSNVPRLLHFESGAWRDVTTSLNVAAKIICGLVSSFSPFAMVEQDDTTPPMMACSVSPSALWPPNNRFRSVMASVSVTDPGGSGPAGFTLKSVTSNEGTSDDIAGFEIGTADTTGSLRARRSGGGSGRRYTLTYEGRDVAGNTATCAVDVVVPHDQRNR